MGIKNAANASFPFQSKICPKLKAQILKMRYHNVQEGSSFTAEKKCEIFDLSSLLIYENPCINWEVFGLKNQACGLW